MDRTIDRQVHSVTTSCCWWRRGSPLRLLRSLVLVASLEEVVQIGGALLRAEAGGLAEAVEAAEILGAHVGGGARRLQLGEELCTRHLALQVVGQRGGRIQALRGTHAHRAILQEGGELVLEEDSLLVRPHLAARWQPHVVQHAAGPHNGGVGEQRSERRLVRP
eukprot:scaffold602_cov342-Prasinococcus_capsulatus_cf.AAC.20